MKKQIVLLIVLGFISYTAFAQKPFETAEKDFTYKFVSDEGTNASAVVWHPVKELYFTVIAGNVGFPLEAFGPNGKSVYSEYAGVDSRGMWYNPISKNIEFNGMDELGWTAIMFDDKFSSHNTEIIISGKHQPGYQDCGTFYPPKKSVAFLNYEGASIDLYNYKNPKKVKSINLQINSDTMEAYNLTSFGYTGIKGYEFVLLNFYANELHFFNSKGVMTAKTSLPESAFASDMFRFAFANNRAFLYDADERVWTAYKVF